MKLKIALEEKTYDVRLLDRLVAQGKIKKSEIEQFLANLPDDEGKYEILKDEKRKS